jgi:hypothetical protein
MVLKGWKHQLNTYKTKITKTLTNPHKRITNETKPNAVNASKQKNAIRNSYLSMCIWHKNVAANM